MKSAKRTEKNKLRFRTRGSVWNLRLWRFASLCIFLTVGLTHAAEEPRHLKEIVSVNGHVARKTTGISLGVSTLAFSPDGKRAATATFGGGVKGAIKVWEIPTLKELKALEVEDLTRIHQLVWSADSRFLAACIGRLANDRQGQIRQLDHYGEVLLWDMDGKRRRVVQHDGPVFKAFFLKDDLVHSLGLGASLLWNLKEENAPVAIPEITLAALDPLWSLTRSLRGGGRRSGKGSPWIYHDVAFSEAAHQIVASAGKRGEDRTVVWDLKTRKEIARQPWYALNLAYSPSGQHIALVASRLENRRPICVELWDNKLRKMFWRSSGYTFIGPEKSICYSPDGNNILSIGRVNSDETVVRFWNSGTGKEVGEFELAKRNKDDSIITSLDVSSDGKFLLIGTFKGEIILCSFPNLVGSDPSKP